MHARRPWSRSFVLAAAFALTAASLVTLLAQGGRGGGPAGPQLTQPVGAPHFEYVGPESDGRIAAAAGVAGKPGTTYYAGAASGGVWKSSDGGATWKPTFDSQASQAIGALAVSQTNPNAVWAGTGEAWAVRDMDMMGDGIYKSTDAGETWMNMGLRETGRIGTIIVHPTDENIVMVCALGRATGPQRERGVFRTEDGGRTWQHVLFVNEDTGCSGLQLSLKDPNIVLASTWQIYLQTHVLESGGPGSGLYISRDGGRTFTKNTDQGLPKSPYGKTDVAIAPSDPNRMYALIQTGSSGVTPWGALTRLPSEAQGSVWRSDDGGRTWRSVSWDRRLIGRAGYYIRIRVSPTDPNDVMIANSSPWRSRDGGASWQGDGGCGDCHDIWWDPALPNHYMKTGDGGMSITTPTGTQNVSLPIGQMYRVTVDQRTPYWVYASRQDDGSMRIASSRPIVPANVPSYAAVPLAAPADAPVGRGAGAGGRAGGRGAAPAGVQGGGRGGRGGGGGEAAQESMPSCESGYTYAEPNNHDIVWGTCYAAHVAVYDAINGTRRSVSPWHHTLDSDPIDLKYRCHWSPPLAINWFDNSVYFGCQLILRTTNRGQTWSEYSPDLSTKQRIRFSGGVVGDNLGQFYGSVVSAIAPSRLARGVVWAGTNDGKVWITRDDGKTWTDLTKNVSMPPWGIIRRIDASHHNPGTAYMAVDYHLVDQRDPYFFKTADYGQTWTPLHAGLPKGHPLDYALAIAENPRRAGMLFAGTGHGFFYSRDDGKTWTQIKDRLPAAPVTWIEVPKNAFEVAVSTYGRGIWILRDTLALEQPELTAQAAGDDLQIAPPLPGVRSASGGAATFVFSLRPPADAGATPQVTMEILDAKGAVISTSQMQARPGSNQVSWNLQYPPQDRPVLRSLPPDNPHIWEGGRFSNRERPVTHWGLASGFRPVVAPGKYTVRLTYNGRPYSKPFEIWKDAALTNATDADLIAGTDLQLKVVAAINDVVDKINRIEIMRMQVEDLRKAQGSDRALDHALAAVYQRMYDTELHYLSRTEMHSDDKWYVEKYKLYMNLVWLVAEIGSGGGDVMGGLAYKPTDAALASFTDRQREMAAAKVDFDRLMQEVAAFNRTNAGKLPPISDTMPAGR